jgi:hypothetical protein
VVGDCDVDWKDQDQRVLDKVADEFQIKKDCKGSILAKESSILLLDSLERFLVLHICHLIAFFVLTALLHHAWVWKLFKVHASV